MRYNWKSEEARICTLGVLQGLQAESLTLVHIHQLKPDDFFWDYQYNSFLFVSHINRQYNQIVCKIYDPDYVERVRYIHYPLNVKIGRDYRPNPDIVHKVVKQKLEKPKIFNRYARISNYGK